MGDAPAGGALDELSMLRASKAVVTAMISAPTSSTIFLASMMKLAPLNRTSCARAPVYSRKLVNIAFAKQPKRRERDGYAIGDLRLPQPPGQSMWPDGHGGDVWQWVVVGTCVYVRVELGGRCHITINTN